MFPIEEFFGQFRERNLIKTYCGQSDRWVYTSVSNADHLGHIPVHKEFYNGLRLSQRFYDLIMTKAIFWNKYTARSLSSTATTK